MIENPYDTKSDSFYFVDNRLIMHNKASYKVKLEGLFIYLFLFSFLIPIVVVVSIFVRMRLRQRRVTRTNLDPR
jgi:hypothetical protein